MALQAGRDLLIFIAIVLAVSHVAGRLTAVDLQAVAQRAAEVAPATAPRGGACRAADALDVCRAAFLDMGARR